MCRLFALTALLLLSVGCSGTDNTAPASASVPATDATSQMVGKWGSGGEVALIVSQADDRVVFSAPENDTWRMDITDAKVDGDTVAFVQKNFLHSGESHPFNGVACETTVRLVDSETMEMTMTTVHSPEPGSELLLRIE